MGPKFEKGIIGAAIVASSIGATEAQGQKAEQIDNSKKIEINVEQNKQVDNKTISFEDAEKIANKGGDYSEGIKSLTLVEENMKEIT